MLCELMKEINQNETNDWRVLLGLLNAECHDIMQNQPVFFKVHFTLCTFGVFFTWLIMKSAEFHRQLISKDVLMPNQIIH